MLIDIQNLEDEEDSKAYKQLINDYRKRAVAEVEKVCALCGKTVTSFCKSHTVPFSWLKNIDNRQKMLSMHSILESNWINQDKGANEAGIFYSICDTCDLESHCLTDLGTHFGIKYLAHDALEDSRSCGKIVKIAADKWGVSSVEDLVNKCGLKVKEI